MATEMIVTWAHREDARLYQRALASCDIGSKLEERSVIVPLTTAHNGEGRVTWR